MPLELRPATAADALRSAEIEAAAYEPSPFNKILFPGPFPPEARAGRAADMAQQLRDNPVLRWVKVVDTDVVPSSSAAGAVGADAEAGEQEPLMIAFAEWHVYTGPSPPSPPREFGPGCNAEACEMLFGGIAKSRGRLMGDAPHVYLRLLHTDPAYQGRGAGRMLVEWGQREARRLGLPAYLEASAAGHALYGRCGFRDLELLSLDMSRWGAPHNHDTWSMRWDPEE